MGIGQQNPYFNYQLPYQQQANSNNYYQQNYPVHPQQNYQFQGNYNSFYQQMPQYLFQSQQFSTPISCYDSYNSQVQQTNKFNYFLQDQGQYNQNTNNQNLAENRQQNQQRVQSVLKAQMNDNPNFQKTEIILQNQQSDIAISIGKQISQDKKEVQKESSQQEKLEEISQQSQQNTKEDNIKYNIYVNAPKNLVKGLISYVKNQRNFIKKIFGNDKFYKKLMTFLNQQKINILSFKKLSKLFEDPENGSKEKKQIIKCLRIIAARYIRTEFYSYLFENRKMKNYFTFFQIRNSLLRGISDPKYFVSKQFLKMCQN